MSRLRQGVDYISLKDQLDTTSTICKAMFFMLVVLAEMESEMTAEFIRESMIKAKRYGNMSGRPVSRPSGRTDHF